MTKKEKLGQDPAFPLDAASEEKLDEGYGKGYPGISKRLYIATKCMQGFLANGRITEHFEKINSKVEDERKALVKASYDIADELLKQENE